jgi:hypothetical protein
MPLGARRVFGRPRFHLVSAWDETATSRDSGAFKRLNKSVSNLGVGGQIYRSLSRKDGSSSSDRLAASNVGSPMIPGPGIPVPAVRKRWAIGKPMQRRPCNHTSATCTVQERGLEHLQA